MHRTDPHRRTNRDRDRDRDEAQSGFGEIHRSEYGYPRDEFRGDSYGDWTAPLELGGYGLPGGSGAADYWTHPYGDWLDRAFRPAGAHAGKGPKGYVRRDERIREDVMDALTHDAHVDATEIEVQVEAGEVTLTGAVHDRHTKRLAEQCADRVTGVRDVHNRLRVQPSPEPEGRDEQRPGRSA